MKDNIKWVLK